MKFLKVLMVIISFFSISTTSFPVFAEENNPSTDAARADIIGYKYKIENGKVWRRLFNYSQNKWIGDWELVPD